MPGSLNWRTKHARKMFTRCGLGAACWLRDGFDLGKRRRRSSTPAVVPGAAPALAKAGVGGYVYVNLSERSIYLQRARRVRSTKFFKDLHCTPRQCAHQDAHSPCCLARVVRRPSRDSKGWMSAVINSQCPRVGAVRYSLLRCSRLVRQGLIAAVEAWNPFPSPLNQP